MKDIPEFQICSLAIVHSFVGVPYSIQARYIRDEGKELEGTTITLGLPLIHGIGDRGSELEIIAGEHWRPFLQFLVGEVPGDILSPSEHQRQVEAGIARASSVDDLPDPSKPIHVHGGLTFADFSARTYWEVQQRMVSFLDPFEVMHRNTNPTILRLPVFTVSGNRRRIEVDQSVNSDKHSLLNPITVSVLEPDPQVTAEAEKIFQGGVQKL